MTVMPLAAPHQLVLDFGQPPSFVREDFVSAPCNADALALIERWPHWPDRAVALVGSEGTGKSHLTAIWAAQAGAKRVLAEALQEADLGTLLATGALVVEDLDPVGVDQPVLFHLLNLVREQGAWLLLTARAAPAAGFTLPDLVSRLRALPVATLAPADETLLQAMAFKLFADRGIDADPGLVRYLLARIERSAQALARTVAMLDEAALALRRPVTRALAAQLLPQASEPQAPEVDAAQAPPRARAGR
ncbi:HdaA/DnaA family protein [Blastochloris tepida]|uniref:Chromosomal replication initiator protein DnaA n=1 Tax=Blastochloris tepida TaxID=2233851 RepID=A0A348G139_9HYPH|nr:chromosomal replication initiator DnaA [Blastochloris tepida]BBF93272.1 chromosomal replication initiator protein DnaA [Blastochloris tepida]